MAMRKKTFFIILFFLLGYQAFGQLVNYPDIMNNGTVFLHGGVGFSLGPDNRYTPSGNIVTDFAVPLFALPFTTGFAVTYAGENKVKGETKSEYNVGIGFRLGYHFNTGVKQLDPYALLTLGGIVSDYPLFWLGLGGGARFFFLPRFGAFAEFTMGNLHNISFGLAFKL